MIIFRCLILLQQVDERVEGTDRLFGGVSKAPEGQAIVDPDRTKIEERALDGAPRLGAEQAGGGCMTARSSKPSRKPVRVSSEMGSSPAGYVSISRHG